MLAYAWAAYPFSLYALQTNTNDGLIAALVVFAIAAMSSPAVRGLLLGLAGAAKFAPLALAPLFLTGRRRVPRESAVFAVVLAGTVSIAVLANLPDGGPRELWDATLGYQLARESPFSLWGLHPGLEWLQTLMKVATVALALLVAVRPRERDLRQLAALAGAVLIAMQLCASYWFYLYIAWFAPVALAALVTAHAAGEPPRRRAPPAQLLPPLAGSPGRSSPGRSEYMTRSRRVPWASSYERSTPSLLKPTRSSKRCEAVLSASGSASTRARASSSSAHEQNSRTARAPMPRPRAEGASQ